MSSTRLIVEMLHNSQDVILVPRHGNIVLMPIVIKYPNGPSSILLFYLFQPELRSHCLDPSPFTFGQIGVK
jgi:hypothetical protein